MFSHENFLLCKYASLTDVSSPIKGIQHRTIDIIFIKLQLETFLWKSKKKNDKNLSKYSRTKQITRILFFNKQG